MSKLPPLPSDFEPTLSSLHAYAKAVAAFPRAMGIAHPRWWHISLDVRPNGLATDAMPLPTGGVFHIRMDPRTGGVLFETTLGEIRQLPLTEGWTATEVGDELAKMIKDLGAESGVDRAQYLDDEARPYDQADAKQYYRSLVEIDRLLERHRVRTFGAGPIQVWAHGFDVAFEWFGTQRVESEEGGEVTESPSQIAYGFYPHGRPYFYAKPWPFASGALLDVDLPSGGQWHTEGWEGATLYYDDVADRDDGAEAVLEFFDAVHNAAAPRLMDS